MMGLAHLLSEWEHGDGWEYYQIPGTDVVLHMNVTLEKERFTLCKPLLDKHAKLWSKMPPLPQYRERSGERCFDVAMEVCKENGLHYCEGLVLWLPPQGGFISLLHAWAVDAYGRVIDPKLPHLHRYPHFHYWGVMIRHDWHEVWKQTTGYYGVLDGHPLLKIGVHYEPVEKWMVQV